ncbi:MAG: TlpA family protein disulfide reductase [Candidatus Solibacter usitatus]|nr:TlpA family protein disulfide reductase [Candidatus Solibacter usitatus]
MGILNQVHSSKLLFVLSLCIAAVAQTTPSQEQYAGTLEAELVPEFSISWTAALSITERQNLPIPQPGRDAMVFEGQLKFLKLPVAEEVVRVLLVESPQRGTLLYADLDHDGRFGPSEEFRFNPVKQRPRAIGDVVLPLRLPNGPFHYFPVRVRLFPVDSRPGESARPEKRTVAYSFWAYATGTVQVDGKPIRVWCQYNSAERVADPRNGMVGMDLDGDGILASSPSPEQSVAKGEAVVFSVGRKFLSIDRIDPASRVIVLRSHPEVDYRRIELRAGVQFPDFEFVDFKGHAHRLSEFSGKYVLLDFWGSWCGPCIGQFPYLKQVYADFRARGLEIIGINSRDSIENAKRCIAEHGLKWVQATSESTSDLVEKRLRIDSYPTLILLDRERRLVMIGGPASEGDLPRTLERLLPPAGPTVP